MSKLHLFNPENDLALATDMPHFTPPRAAIQLADSLACLPAWWADPGDLIVCDNEDAEWLTSVNPEIKQFDGSFQPDSLAPWGWSRYTRQLFSLKGVDTTLLPSDAKLNEIRALSHRRLTAEIYATLKNEKLPYPLPPAPREVSDIDVIVRSLERGDTLYIKSPWSGSGRGIINTSTTTAAQAVRLAQGIIRRQGSVMVEYALDKVADFAMLFDITSHKAVFKGLSLFYNESYSTYSGNILGSPEYLKAKLCKYITSKYLNATLDAVSEALGRTLPGRYEGPVGVDMMIYRLPDGSFSIAPCVEVNLRMTMGRVAHELYSRHLPEGFTGLMQLQHGDIHTDTEVFLRLTPSGKPFGMIIKALSDADIVY
ncbi:MAG: hypothetical protein K2I64_01550 [Muribaculaceae bacterium]|nr:hypothetical protein [Muribaculaceae bacterium]